MSICIAEHLLSRPRLQPYLVASENEIDSAVELYRWNQRMSGAVLKQASDVEIAVRNALDIQLRDIAARFSKTDDWIGLEPGETPEMIYRVLGKCLNEARDRACRALVRRPPDHPRHGQALTRDDVLSQLMFGAWDMLLGANLSRCASGSIQQRLWVCGLYRAFPHSGRNDIARRDLARRLKRVRTLRNRAAHAENLLQVDLRKRLDDMLSVLSAINPEYATWSMQGSQYRMVLSQRPTVGGNDA